MRRWPALASTAIAAAVAVAAASSKTMPTLEQATARPGDRVGVRIAGAMYYRAPLQFYLVTAGMAEGGVCGQAKPTLDPIAVVGQAGHKVGVEHFRFTVPKVAPGRYTIAMRFRGTASKRSGCIIAPGDFPAAPQQKTNVLRVTR
jgi:hypothetical protein